METAVPQTELHCPQCGGELHPEAGQLFLVCPFCNSTVYLDKSGVVFHWSLSPTLDESKARGALARWMAGNETVKDLDKKSQVVSASFEYFPIWYLKRREPDESEEMLIELAAASSVSELRQIKLPAGDLQKYDTDLDSQSLAPSVPLSAALSWLSDRGIPQEQIIEKSLVHIPLYTFKYVYKNQAYTAVVEAGTGRVFANIYPAKAETPYRTVGCLTALCYVILAIIPLYFSLERGWAGTGLGMFICVGIGLLTAPIFFGLAALIAAKV